MELVITCMDRRLNKLIAQRHPNAYVVRNAGGNVYTLENTLRGLRPSRVYLYTHTDCGALKYIFDALQGKATPHPAAGRILDLYRGARDLEELERIHFELQLKRLRELFGDVQGEVIDLRGVNPPLTRPTLLVMPPGPPDYPAVDLDQTWIIQADPADLELDLHIAKALGIRHVLFHEEAARRLRRAEV